MAPVHVESGTCLVKVGAKYELAPDDVECYMVGAEYERWRNVVVKLVESSLMQNALATTTISILVGAKYELGEP